MKPTAGLMSGRPAFGPVRAQASARDTRQGQSLQGELPPVKEREKPLMAALPEQKTGETRRPFLTREKQGNGRRCPYLGRRRDQTAVGPSWMANLMHAVPGHRLGRRCFFNHDIKRNFKFPHYARQGTARSDAPESGNGTMPVQSGTPVPVRRNMPGNGARTSARRRLGRTSAHPASVSRVGHLDCGMAVLVHGTSAAGPCGLRPRWRSWRCAINGSPWRARQTCAR